MKHEVNVFNYGFRKYKDTKNQLLDQINALEVLYNDYSIYTSGEAYYPTYIFSLPIGFWQIALAVVGLLTGGVARYFVYRKWYELISFSLAAVLCVILPFLVIRANDYFRNRYYPGERFVTFFIATHKNINRVQAEINKITPEVEELRSKYAEQQAEKARENFIKKLEEAKKFAPALDHLLKVAETELKAVIDRTLSSNGFDLDPEVTLSAAVRIPELDDKFLRCWLPNVLDVSAEEQSLRKFAIYIALLTSFKKEFATLLTSSGLDVSEPVQDPE